MTKCDRRAKKRWIWWIRRGWDWIDWACGCCWVRDVGDCCSFLVVAMDSIDDGGNYHRFVACRVVSVLLGVDAVAVIRAFRVVLASCLR
jgi:hypothetical protein